MSTGDAGNGQVAANAGGEAANGGEAQQGPDIGQLASSLEEMRAGQEELRQFLVQQQTQSQTEPEGDDGLPELDLSFLTGEPQVPAEPDAQEIAQRLNQVIAQQVEQLTRQQVEPLRNDLMEQRREQQAQMLVNEFPELADQQVATEMLGAARQLAQHIAESVGQPELAETLANHPPFWRTTYLAGRAQQTLQEEAAESAPAAHLEGGSGAAPGAQQVDPTDAIFAGATERGRRALPFS